MAQVQQQIWKMKSRESSAVFQCGPGRTLLDAMIDARCGEIKVGCRSGGCGICRVRITSGSYESRKMTRSRISEQDEAAGIVLACRILPRSDISFVPLPLAGRNVPA